MYPIKAVITLKRAAGAGGGREREGRKGAEIIV